MTQAWENRREALSSRWSDWVWHKPRAWAATEESSYSLPYAPGRSLGEGYGQRKESELGEGAAQGSLCGALGIRGVCPTWAGADAGISGVGLAHSSGPGPSRVNPLQAESPSPAHPPPPSAAGPSASSRDGCLGSPLGYRPRLLGAAAAAAATITVAGCPQSLLLCQPLLLLLPPPPPPRPHRSHRRCGDYCSAR